MEVDTVHSDSREPRLGKMKLRKGYDAVMALKSVVVDPFNDDMLQDENFLYWLKECESYTIVKKKNNSSIAVLKFSTVEKGENALMEMETLNTEVSHTPLLYSTFAGEKGVMPGSEQRLFLEKNFNEEELTDEFWARIVVLEGLTAESNTEEKLQEFFPEAYTVVSYQFDPLSAGIAVLEFATIADAETFLSCANNEVTIDETQVKISKYTDRVNEFNSITSKEAKEKAAMTGGEKIEVTDDNSRVDLNTQITTYEEEVASLQRNHELFGNKKLERFSEIFDQLKQMRHVLMKDTTKRLKEGNLDLPEGESAMLDIVKEAWVKKKEQPNKSLRTAQDPELVRTQLEQFDKEYDEAVANIEKLVNKIRSTEGQLDPEEKKARQAKSKLPPLTGKRHAGKAAAATPKPPVPVVVKQPSHQDIVSTAQLQTMLKNQKATANLVKAARGRGVTRGGPVARGRGMARGRGGMARGAGGQKRPGIPFNQGEGMPPFKMGRGRGRGYGGNSVHDIAQFANQLNAKMSQLEEMHQETLQTQNELMSRNSGGRGGGQSWGRRDSYGPTRGRRGGGFGGGQGGGYNQSFSEDGFNAPYYNGGYNEGNRGYNTKIQEFYNY